MSPFVTKGLTAPIVAISSNQTKRFALPDHMTLAETGFRLFRMANAVYAKATYWLTLSPAPR
jgi:hypothetical protein